MLDGELPQAMELEYLREMKAKIRTCVHVDDFGIARIVP